LSSRKHSSKKFGMHGIKRALLAMSGQVASNPADYNECFVIIVVFAAELQLPLDTNSRNCTKAPEQVKGENIY
jgi:hypothetical protein